MAHGSSTSTTIRMVPQSQPETMAAGALIPETTYQQHQKHDGDVRRRKAITVTRTIDIEPGSSPAPTKSASMENMFTRAHVQTESSVNQQLRTVTSVGALLPTIPKMSAIDLTRPFVASAPLPHSRPSTAPGLEEHLVPPPLAPKLPPFMQSRRWARMCEATARPKSSAHERVLSQEDRPMTLREASFEQQRAIWRHAVTLDKPEPIEEASAKSQQVLATTEAVVSHEGPPRPDDVSSIVATQGLCRPLSLPTWQIVRATRAGRTSSQSTGNVFRKLTVHRTGTTKHRRQPSVEKTPPRVPRSSQMGRKRAVSDLRKKADPSVQNRRAIRSHVVNLDFDTPPPVRDERPSSPVPSLHDPEKAKRFSEECEEMLSNSNFEKDFITPAPSRSPTDSSKKPAVSQPPPQDRGQKANPVAQEKSKGPEMHTNVRIEPPSPMLTAPEPPERSSSKNAARLATVVQLTKPAWMPILNGFKDGAMVTADDVSEQMPAQQSLVVPQPTRAPFRMVSNASTVRSANDSPKGPRNAMSTDTLMLIEAQVSDQTPTSLVERLKQKTGFGSSVKKLGPSGQPPERPLPDLPAENTSVSTRGVPGRLASSSSKRASKQSTSSQAGVERDRPEPGADQASVPRAPNIAAAKGLSIKAADNDSLADSILPTPSSVYSQASFVSELSTKPKFVRHDKTQFRAERIKELKRRYKADLDRDRRISEEGEDDTEGEQREIIKVYRDIDPPLPPLPHLRETPSLDQLDQFPPVPASRPASRASHNSGSKRAQSRPRSHVRQSSKASSRHSYRPAVPRVPNSSTTMSRQILGASQIRVLVDTNPVTGRFRAGAISPESASSISSIEGSPVKSKNLSLAGGLRSSRSTYLPLPSRIDENGDSYDHTSTTSGSPVRQRNDDSPKKKTSLRSVCSHTSAGRRSATASRQSHHRGVKLQSKHRRMSFDTYASLNSSPSSSPSASEDEAEIPLLPLSTSTTTTALNIASPNDAKVSTTPQTKKLRRRWNSNDIRTVQMLYDDLEEYYDKLMAQERELQKQREEIRMMVRVMVPMGKARGLKTDGLVSAAAGGDDDDSHCRDISSVTIAPPPNTSVADHRSCAGTSTAVSIPGSPSRTTQAQHVPSSSPARRGPYMHANSHSYSSSKAQLDAAAAALDAVLRERGHAPSTASGTDRDAPAAKQDDVTTSAVAAAATATAPRERPISNVSTLSATTHSSHGSGGSTASSAKLVAGPSSSARRRRDRLDLSNGEEAEPRRSKEEGSLTDPREYELDLSSPTFDPKARLGLVDGPTKEQPQQQSRATTAQGHHVKASSMSTSTATAPDAGLAGHRPKSRGTLSMRSFRSRTKSSNKESTKPVASPVVNLHRPPPIPKRIKREVLSEEEDGYLSAASLLGTGSSTPDLLSGLSSGPVGTVRKQGYLRLQGLAGESSEALVGGGGDAVGDVQGQSDEGAGGEMGVREVRKGLGLDGVGDADNDKLTVALGHNINDGLLAVNDGGDDDGDDHAANRLSVNHVFTRTEAWDRMLESFS